MTFLSNYLNEKKSDKKAADYIVPLTGKAYLYSEQNVTLKKVTLLFLIIMGTEFLTIKRTKKYMSISVTRIYLLPLIFSAMKTLLR